MWGHRLISGLFFHCPLLTKNQLGSKCLNSFHQSRNAIRLIRSFIKDFWVDLLFSFKNTEQYFWIFFIFSTASKSFLPFLMQILPFLLSWFILLKVGNHLECFWLLCKDKKKNGWHINMDACQWNIGRNSNHWQVFIEEIILISLLGIKACSCSKRGVVWQEHTRSTV